MEPFRNNCKVLALIHRLTPGRIALQILERCASLAYGSFYSLLLFRFLIDALEHSAPLSNVAGFLLLFVGAGLAVDLFKAWFHNLYRPKSDQWITKALTDLLQEKAKSADLTSYENPEYYDRYTLAAEQAVKQSLLLVETVAMMCGVIFALFLNAGFVLFVDPSTLLLSAIPITLSFFFERQRSERTYRMECEAVPHRRRAEYVRRTVYLAEYAKELRITTIFSVLKRNFSEAMQQLQKNVKRHGVWIALYRFIAEFALQVLLFLSLYGYIVWRYLAKNAFPLGDFASLSGAIINFAGFVEDLAGGYNDFHRIGGYVGDLLHFLEKEPAIRDGAEDFCFRRTIEFRSVGFTYPGQKQPALQDVSFTIQRGERIAIVGFNGAGKSTLVKLLLRLYEPQCGEILVDGRPLTAFRLNSLRSEIVCAPQDFHLYSATVANNVLMRPAGPEDEECVRNALKAVGLEIDDPMHTLLTKEFSEEGLNLSGGQSQKLAVARIFASDAPIAVLDEPSSALDPISEAAMFQSLLAAGKSRTILFVSHRLSSVQAADRILVFERAELVEDGTHQELMEQEGLYAAMWRIQAENDRKEKCV